MLKHPFPDIAVRAIFIKRWGLFPRLTCTTVNLLILFSRVEGAETFVNYAVKLGNS